VQPRNHFLDYWARWERLPHAEFKDTMGGKALWAGALLGTGSWPGDVLDDAGAVQRARSFFD
jgi:hypothetical protein